ncbi:MAG: thioredoxin family protein [Thiohalomonadaceae bacterium]
MRYLQVMMACLLLWTGAVHAEVTVPQPTDLREEAALASARRVPVLLMFSAEHCPYCMRMEDEFLEPMILSGDYEDKVVIRKLELGEGTLRDFDGRTVTVNELAERYKVYVTPTLVFLDAAGRQLTEKMVGLSTPDFFGGYLDDSIDTSLARLRRSGALAARPGACAPSVTC